MSSFDKKLVKYQTLEGKEMSLLSQLTCMEQKQGQNREIQPTALPCQSEAAQCQSSQAYCSGIPRPTTLILNRNLKQKPGKGKNNELTVKVLFGQQ